MGLGSHKWYESEVPGDVPMRRLSPEEGWTRGGVPARTMGPKGGGLRGSTSMEEGNECQ